MIDMVNNKWYKNSLVWVIIAGILYTPAYLGLRALLIHCKDNHACYNYPSLRAAGAHILSHLDYAGYYIGVATFLIGLYVTFKASHKQNKDNSKLTEIIKKIDIRTDELGNVTQEVMKRTGELADATRAIIADFPNLLKSIKELLEKAIHQKNNSELYILNCTCAFGHVHQYNEDILRQFVQESEPNAPLSADELHSAREAIQSSVGRIETLLREGVRKKWKECHFKFYNEEALDKFFFPNLFSDPQIQDSLKYVDYVEGRHTYKASSFDETIAFIRSDTISQNNELLKDLIEKRDKMHFTSDAAKIETFLSEYDIPMQLYLCSYKEDNTTKYESLVIYAVNDETPSKRKQRILLGISSSLPIMFNVFKTIFEDTPKKTALQS